LANIDWPHARWEGQPRDRGQGAGGWIDGVPEMLLEPKFAV